MMENFSLRQFPRRWCAQAANGSLPHTPRIAHFTQHGLGNLGRASHEDQTFTLGRDGVCQDGMGTSAASPGSRQPAALQFMRTAHVYVLCGFAGSHPRLLLQKLLGW